MLTAVYQRNKEKSNTILVGWSGVWRVDKCNNVSIIEVDLTKQSHKRKEVNEVNSDYVGVK